MADFFLNRVYICTRISYQLNKGMENFVPSCKNQLEVSNVSRCFLESSDHVSVRVFWEADNKRIIVDNNYYQEIHLLVY